jgi:D-alanyl-D-alanine carboxypeptidase
MERISFGLYVFLLLFSSCSVYRQDLDILPCADPTGLNPNYSKADDLQAAMQQLVEAGVPGCAMALYSEEEGWWVGAAGLAKIEDRTPMQVCHLQYLQSIAKTYMAVAVLRLYEQGKIDLDAPVTRYLPEKYSRYVSGAGRVTVRMLLNHTSGIPEYNFSPDYVAYLLQHPDHYFTGEDYLRYIEGKPLNFEPGSKYMYTNTNYVLLALLADAMAGDHAQLIRETIFEPLELTQTFYRDDPNYPNYRWLVNSYWDRYGNGIVENASQMQRNNVAALIGDDGIVATPIEAVKFLKGLMEGKLLKPATLEEMKTWVNNGQGNPAYGLGLSHTVINGQVGYGHSGGGIGAGCELRYFPEKKTYVFVAINLGTVTESVMHEEAAKRRDVIYEVLLR